MLNKPTGDMLNAAGSATPQGLGTAAAGTSAAYSREDHVHAIPTLSGDVTNDGASVTVAKIQSSPVASTTPASGQVLTWDGAQWAPATNSSGGGGGANGLTYYLNQGTAADAPTTGIAGTPHQLGRTGESGQTTVTTGALTQNVWTLVAGFVSESTPIDPDVTLIPAGLWDFNIWAYGDANVNAGTSIRCRVYKYNGTTLTEIASPSSDQVINGTSAQYSLSVLVPQTTLELTDRIYVAIEARATGSNHTVTAQFGDSTPSHVHTSLPLVGGTGLWKSLAGVLQSPASLLVNADVDAAAGIAWSKIAPSYLGTRVKVVGRDAATIQGCIDLCTDADGEHPYTVLIPPIAASYSESLTLKGSVSLVGLTTQLNADAVQITGAHTFTPASPQANTNRINFQNLTFISSGTSSNTITCSSSTKYFSKLTFSGCIFSGDKADTYSHIRTDDNVAVYVDNCRFESSAGGSASAGITQGNGPLYLSNNTTFDISGRAIDVPASTTTTRTATVTAGVGGSTTMTLTSGDTTGLAVGMKISGVNLGTTVTVVSLTAPSTVVMSTPPKTSGSFTATFGQTPYVEIHDSVLAGKGAETVRLGNGLLTCNTSNFTNTASGGSGINMLTANTVIGMVNSSFSIADAAAYTITAAAATCYAALNSVSFSNSFLAAYSTLIGANVTVADYSARATSIENGGTGATTRQAAINALAGAVTANQVLAGNGSNITLRALAAADIPSLAASKITSGQLAVAQGGTGTTAGIANINTTQIAALTTAQTANLIPKLTTSGLISLAQLGGIGTTQIAALTTAQTANLIPQLTTSGLLSLTQMPTIPVANGGTGATSAANAKLNLGVQLKASCGYATIAALPANTASNPTLTAIANGQLAVDGVTFASAGDRILVKNEVATATNGIYDVTNPGSAGAPWVLTRAADYNASAEINSDDLIPVRLGSNNRSTLWTQKNNITATGTDPIVFECVTPANIHTDASNNIVVGNTATYAGALGTHLMQIWGGAIPLSFMRNSASATPINLEFAKSKGGSGWPGAALSTNDYIGRLYFSGSDGTTMLPAAYVDTAIDGTVTTNGMPGRLVFSTTTSGAASPTERLRIDSNGNVYAASGTTGMTGGFIWTAAAAGTPTAAPTSAPTGRVPLYYDTTANKLYVYNGGWKASAAFA